jgi:hypothetical protein
MITRRFADVADAKAQQRNVAAATQLHASTSFSCHRSYPLISLADAREQARKILRENQLGRYERAEERQGLTLGEVVPEFIAKHVMVKNRDRGATPGWSFQFRM